MFLHNLGRIGLLLSGFSYAHTMINYACKKQTTQDLLLEIKKNTMQHQPMTDDCISTPKTLYSG